MTLEQALRYVVLAGIFALPLIVFFVAQSLYFPFITGKNFTFRIIVEVMTGAWLALAVMNPKFRPRRSWLLGAFTAFVVIILAADLFGVNPFKSIWSNFERMDGWVTLVHLFAYFVVTATVLNTEKLWRALFHTSLAVSVLVGLYALLQLFGIASLNPGFSSAARLDATFGNPIYLASYMLFHVFLAALLFAQSIQERGNKPRGPYPFFYLGAGLFAAFIMFLTGTRGAILGFAGGLILAVLLYAWFTRDNKRLRQIAIGVVACTLLCAGVLFLVRDQEWARQAPVIGRLASISLDDSTTKARLMNWGMAWEGFKERPVLGWGQENYAIVFSKYYNPQMFGQEQWFDRVHNVIFDWLVAGGLLGLVAYLSLFGISFWYFWKDKKTSGAFTLSEKSIVTGLLAAYFFHNLFVFDNIMSYVLFATVLAYIAFRVATHVDAKHLFQRFAVESRMFPLVAGASVVLVWGAAWFVNADALSANRTLLQGLAPQSEGILKNLEHFEKAISYGSFGTQEAREQLLQAAVQVSRIEQVPVDVKQKFLETAAREMSLQSQASPLDPRFPLFTGFLLNAYGVYDKATEILETARVLSPTKQTILYEMAANALARGDAGRAQELYKQAFELAQNNNDARIYYAMLAIRTGQDALADELIAPLIEVDAATDPRITAAYVERNRYDKIVVIWEAHVKAQPRDVQGHFTLAAAYHSAGETQKAIAQLRAVAEIDPSVQGQAEALIRDILGQTQ